MNLIAWLSGVLTSMTGWFATWMVSRAALAAAALSVMAGVWLVFALGITGAISGLAVALPSWAAGAMIFIPTNVSTCISALITAKISRMVFEYQREMIRVVSYIT